MITIYNIWYDKSPKSNKDLGDLPLKDVKSGIAILLLSYNQAAGLIPGFLGLPYDHIPFLIQEGRYKATCLDYAFRHELGRIQFLLSYDPLPIPHGCFLQWLQLVHRDRQTIENCLHRWGRGYIDVYRAQ